MKQDKIVSLINEASMALLQAKEGQANELLTKLYDELLALAPLLSPEKLVCLTQVMEIIYDAQQRRDYIYLVDILKYNLLVLLAEYTVQVND